MNDDALSQFFRELASSNVAILSINMEENGTLIARLQGVLQGFESTKDLEALVEKQKLQGGNWTRFNIMVTSFLKFCRDVDPWSLWRSSDLIFIYYQDLTNCLLNDNFPVDKLVTLFQETTEYVVPLAKQLDIQYNVLGTRKYQFLSHVASVITKLFNSIKPRFEEPAVSFNELLRKQQILLYTANKLNNIYMRIESPASCANIFKNVKPKSAIQNFSQFPVNEQVEYRYLLGRYYLLNHRVSNAFHQLNSAFGLLAVTSLKASRNNEPVSSAVKRNLQRILKYLLPAGILFGKLPSASFSAQVSPQLSEQYIKLVNAIQAGCFLRFHHWLAQNETILREQKLFILLLEKVPLLIYRNLIRRVILEICLPRRQNKISYALLERALQISLGSANEMQQTKLIYTAINVPGNIPNVLESLINLTLLKANCFPLSAQCVFPKTTNISDVFPPINEKLVALFPLNTDDSWLDE